MLHELQAAKLRAMSLPAPAPTPNQQSKGWLREPPWWFQDIVIALLTGLVLLAFQWQLDAQAGERADDLARQLSDASQRTSQELARDALLAGNLRYIREHSTPTGADRPAFGIDLQGQPLDLLNLSNGDLRQAKLSETSMRRVRLIETDLHYADLSRADLTRALLEGTRLQGAVMRDADLSSAHVVRAKFSGTDLRGAVFFHTWLLDTDMTSVDLSGADMRRACFGADPLRYCNFKDLATGRTLPVPGNYQPRLVSVCYDDATKWPPGFVPGSSDPEACH